MPEQRAGRWQQAQVVGGPLPVAHQYSPAPGPPAQSQFHYANAAPESASDRPSDANSSSPLPNAPNLRLIPVGCRCVATSRIVRSFVQAQVRSGAPGVFRACHYDTGQGLRQQFGVRHIAPGPPRQRSKGLLAYGAVRQLPFPFHTTPPHSAHSAAGTARMPGKTPFCTQRWKVRWMVLSSPRSRGKGFH